MRWCQTAFITVFLLSWTLAISDSEQNTFSLICELPAFDDVTISDERIVEVCSKILKNNTHGKSTVVRKALLHRGVSLAQLKRFEEAEKDFDKLCVLEPENAEPLCRRSAVLAALEKFPEAMRDAKKAHDLEPNLPLAHLTLAQRMWDEGSPG